MTVSDSPTSSATFQRILIVRLSSMGDVIHTLRAAATLRAACPHATIGWLIEERWAELLCTLPTPRSGRRSPQRPLVDLIHTVNLKRWRSSLLSNQTWERIAAGLSDLRAVRYDVAIDLQGAIRSAILARWSGAPVVYGAAQPRENLASMGYTRKVIPGGTHVIEQYAGVAEALIGRAVPMPSAVFPCDPLAEAAVDRRLRQAGITGFAILNPGAGWGAKQWPAGRYGEVAKVLAQSGLKSIINFGPGEEALARAAESASDHTAEAMTFSVGELIALTRRARLFIGGDTGPMHLAAALGVPVVAIFGPTDPARNGPFATRKIVLRHPKSPNTLTHRAQPDPGILEITADEVVAAARQLLGAGRG
ncbi:MAG TPA: glycosyltransferase family 9 protein [Terriglobales bacterium]|jgi:heptosyltransferase-1|nr:glycosyltransferase family 9 protein [Terriglobales bacterium]